jgi:DNA-binding LytR/AlgR family response regulator
MNVLVIEYEKTKAQKIKDLLSQIDDSIQVIGITNNMQTAAAWLAKNKEPDIILANEEVVPFMHLKRSRDIKAVVTFSTISEEYNFAAYRYKTMRRLLNANNEKTRIPETNKKHLNSSDKDTFNSSFKERFLVKQGQRLLSIPVGQVAYFFSQERFIFLKTFDNQKFLVEYRIEQLEKLLSPDIFFRINRSHIISLTTVKEIHAYFGNRLKLYLSPAADKEIIVSRKRVNDFKDWLDK